MHYFSNLLYKLLIIRIYHNAWSFECQIKNCNQKCKESFDRMKNYTQESVDKNRCILLYMCISWYIKK